MIGQASTALPMDGGYPAAPARRTAAARRRRRTRAALLLELQPADGGTAGAALQLRFDEAAERRRWARTISRWIVEGARPWWRTGEP